MNRVMKHKNGVITIETAISSSVVLVLIALLIMIINIHRTDVVMEMAVEQTCEEISILFPFSVTAQDVISTGLNALPEKVLSNEKINGVVGEVLGGAYQINDLTNDKIVDLLADVAFSRKINNDIANEFVKISKSDFLLPDDIDTHLYFSKDKKYVGMEVEYIINFPAHKVNRTIYSVIPVYGEFNLNLNDEKKTDEKDKIWSLSNFERGYKFREIFGANLPKTFPTISKYSEDTGAVVSMVSIDTTAPSYNNVDDIMKIIENEASKLSDFAGANVNISGQNYVVEEGKITSRELKVIIPQNGTVMDEMLIKECSDRYNIIITKEIYGNSYRYKVNSEEKS